MKVRTQDLRLALEKTLAYLDAMGHSDVDVPHDYYWNVPQDDRFDPYHNPPELTMGQLSDDLAHVHRIAKGSEEPIVYSLVWIAAVLRAVGETTDD